MSPTNITVSALAEHVKAIAELGRQTVKNIVEIGRRLSECRALLKEDQQWRAWLQSQLRLSPQTAGRFIQVYELSGDIPSVEHLQLPISGLYLLAAPSTPQEARDQIIERAQAGETVPAAEVKRVIEDAKGRKRPPSSKPGKPNPARPKPSDADVVESEWKLLRPSEKRAVQRIFNQFSKTPGAAQRHFLNVHRDSEDFEIEELQADKRRLEIKVAGLESEVEELKAAARLVPESKPAARCSICHQKKRAPLRPSYTCDDGVHIRGVGKAPPPADDGLDIPRAK